MSAVLTRMETSGITRIEIQCPTFMYVESKSEMIDGKSSIILDEITTLRG